ncbi:MAG: FAD-binding protein [Flavisolibacter sp.]
MKRETFLKLSSSVLAAPFLQPLIGWARQGKLKNWAGNIEFSTEKVFYPKTVRQVQEIVKKCDHLKALGTRHCFNRIADSKFNLISTKYLNKIASIDPAKKTVTVEGGIKYGELSPYLHEKGFALNNLASLPHISVAGSIATATHGSGVKNSNLSSAVTALEVVIADGSVINFSREKDGDKFLGLVASLGAIGVITKVTLAIEPTYWIAQHVFLNLPFTQLKDNFEKIVSVGYSVSLFTDWQTENINSVWIKSKVFSEQLRLPLDFFGATAATKNLHPIVKLSAENCTEQMGLPGPWYERLPHFKMGFTPSSGKELQAEYFVPFNHAVEAILAISRLGKIVGPHLLISEIRTIKKDDLWMSPCRSQDCVTIHFTWKPEWDAVRQILPLIEKELAPFNARPHWGKLFTMAPQALQSQYEKMEDFKKLAAKLDPQRKFQNDFLKKNIFG